MKVFDGEIYLYEKYKALLKDEPEYVKNYTGRLRERSPPNKEEPGKYWTLIYVVTISF